jgi:hypothetical protein
MKHLKKLIFVVVLVLSYHVSNAQYVDIMPYVGYQFAANVDVWMGTTSNSGRLRIKPAGNYGLEIDVVLPYNDISISASFSNAQTYLTFQQTFGAEEKLFDASQQYWMFGVSKEVDMDKLRPFGGLILGWTTINPDDPDNPQRSNLTKFTVGLKGGLKFFISDRIGLFVRARLLLPVQWSGGGIWFGGGGSGVSLSAGTSIVTGDVGGGIIISLGSK